MNPPVQVSVLNGELAILNCGADGFPTPAIQWKFRHVEILNGGRYSINEQGILNIMNVGLDDIGIYVCTASNAIGYATGNISLSIQGQLKLLKNDIILLVYSCSSPSFYPLSIKYDWSCGKSCEFPMYSQWLSSSKNYLDID